MGRRLVVGEIVVFPGNKERQLAAELKVGNQVFKYPVAPASFVWTRGANVGATISCIIGDNGEHPRQVRPHQPC